MPDKRGLAWTAWCGTLPEETEEPMSLTIRNDPARLSGGHALLEGTGLAGVEALTVENVSNGLFLSAGGRWAKQSHPFPVEPKGEALRLGPAIVDHVPEELLIALRSSAGRDLGRLFWLDVMPSRGCTVAAPPVAPASPAPATLPVETRVPAPPSPEAPRDPPSAESPPETPPPPVAAGPLPVATRSARRALPRAVLVVTALVVLLAAGGAWALLRRPAQYPTPPVPPQDQARHCVDGFGPKAEAAHTGSDDDRVKIAEAALAGGCGVQALAALDGADWEMSEAAAWHLARFYDPNETDPAVRAAEAPHPDWAATYYAHWAPRVPREAAALRQLCTTDAAALDANAQLRRACGR